MTTGDEIFRRIQSKARSDGATTTKPAPTGEYLTRHALESFLDRLMHTRHAGDFVVKGGLLLGAYGVRRPTRDADAEAIETSVTAEHIVAVVRDIAAVLIDDGVAFDIDSISTQEIRDQAEYPGIRLRINYTIGPARGVAAWDVSAGDPIVPAPRRVRLPRVLGDAIELLGYAAETTVAEKGVTILERGITSTRWRDYVDIVQLCRSHDLNEDDVFASARAVARHRGIRLEPIATHMIGYGAIAQPRWAAWRRKEGLQDISEENLDDQLALVSRYLDPIFARHQG